MSRLPNINENLWSRYASEKEGSQVSNVENKKKEILSFIDTYSTKSFSQEFESNSFNSQHSSSSRNSKNTEIRYDPKARSHIRPESYWNDWFGRPGAGAPNFNAQKKNLDDMLEPRRTKVPNVYRHEPYNPSIIGEQTPKFLTKKYKSDHHNSYEITPR